MTSPLKRIESYPEESKEYSSSNYRKYHIRIARRFVSNDCYKLQPKTDAT
jgi:hypothetical protein